MVTMLVAGLETMVPPVARVNYFYALCLLVRRRLTCVLLFLVLPVSNVYAHPAVVNTL